MSEWAANLLAVCVAGCIVIAATHHVIGGIFMVREYLEEQRRKRGVR